MYIYTDIHDIHTHMQWLSLFLPSLCPWCVSSCHYLHFTHIYSIYYTYLHYIHTVGSASLTPRCVRGAHTYTYITYPHIHTVAQPLSPIAVSVVLFILSLFVLHAAHIQYALYINTLHTYSGSVSFTHRCVRGAFHPVTIRTSRSTYTVPTVHAHIQ